MNELVQHDRCDDLFELAAKDRPKLAAKDNVVRLAKLKAVDPQRYEELFDQFRANKIPRLRDLEEEVRRAMRNARQRAERTIAQRDIPNDDFERDLKSGAVLSTQKNIRLAIKRLGVTLRFNSFRGEPIIEGLHGFGPSLDDHALRRLWLSVDERFSLKPQMDFFHTVISDACYSSQFHPVRDYLDGLTWDGHPRLDTWLIRYAGVNDSPYSRAVGRNMLIAAVRRVRHPGCKHDEMLVLESPEGFNKSSLLKVLAVNDDWFSDSLQLNVDDKKMIENSRGKWIIEVSELQGNRKGDVGVIKAQLSRQSDRARMAYERMPVEVPRQFVFFGSVNPAKDAGYLASLTGNRRFWPVEVQRVDLDSFQQDRDQLWAEAAEREAQGESARLDAELWDAAAAEQRKRESPNPLYDVLLPILGHQEGIIFASDVWSILGIPTERRSAHYEKMGAAMKALGWTGRKRRIPGGAKVGVYYRGESKAVLRLALALDDRVIGVEPSSEETLTEDTEGTTL